MIDLTRKPISNREGSTANVARPTIVRIGGSEKAARGLGDMVEMLAKPIAVALKLNCLDEQKQLKPESPCARRRAWLNAQGKKVGIGVPKA